MLIRPIPICTKTSHLKSNTACALKSTNGKPRIKATIDLGKELPLIGIFYFIGST